MINIVSIDINGHYFQEMLGNGVKFETEVCRIGE